MSNVTIKIIRSNLNKITESNKERIILEIKKAIRAIEAEHESIFTTIVEILFSKSMTDDKFIDLYAEVCHEVTMDLFRSENKVNFTTFYTLLIKKYQSFFEDDETIEGGPGGGMIRNMSFSSINKSESNDTVSVQSSPLVPSTPLVLQKNRCTIFITKLIHKGFINPPTVGVIIKDLIKKRKFESACIIINNTIGTDIGTILFQENSDVLKYAKSMKEHFKDPGLTKRIRFIIEDTLKLIE